MSKHQCRRAGPVIRGPASAPAPLFGEHVAKSSSKPKTLADGKNWRELDDLAKQAVDRHEGGPWPRIVRELLKRNYELEKRNQQLAQGELFGHGVIAPRVERNGV